MNYLYKRFSVLTLKQSQNYFFKARIRLPLRLFLIIKIFNKYICPIITKYQALSGVLQMTF